ncbi:MAG TPA: Calx-beta domain-containing protein [Vicinamibacteria bacterium]|nr:Calx-beta domain-containing protein [Vicinamibacteria bacterium]
MKRRALAGLALAAALAAGEAGAQPACTHWVAPPPAGNDANPGTSAQPWATLDFASARILALGLSGSVVCFKNGVYTGGNSLYERFAVPTTFRAENAYRAVLQNNSRALSLFGARNMVFEGFEFRHTGPGAAALVIQVQMADLLTWSEDVVFRNNVMHDSWNNDILKINNGARRITVEGNVFYNQTGSDEHMDVNSVTDVVIQDNIFFNDFTGSGRPNANDTSSFIVMKDSNQGDDGQIGADRITVRRNVFLGWEGSGGSNFVLIGEDGNDYFEGEDILVENNLMIGNSGNDMRAAFGVKGGRNVTFRSNTVTGNLPALAYAFRVNREGANPLNENVRFHNNIWSDPTGTMGAEAAGGTNDFSDGAPSEVTGLVLDRNLYWNGGAAIPPGDQVNPNVNDTRRIVANPQLATNHSGIVLPRWNGTSFPSGNTTIRQEFVRLVGLYGAIPAGSPGHDQADPALSPADDILGNPRTTPDVGAFEVTAPPALSIADLGVTEGSAGTTQAVFAVTLSAATGAQVTVAYAASAGTATAGADFTAVSGTLTMPAGAPSGTILVPVVGDALDEADETFMVTLSGPVGATLGDGQATGTILDDDPLPALAVDDCGVTEGDAGQSPCSFVVRLTPASGRSVNVSFDTQDGTATAGSDYTAAAGSLTFAAGTSSQTVAIAVLGDTTVEPDEAFAVRLLTPANATLADAQADGTILDDDAVALSSLELTHGSSVVADLAGGTADLYRLAQGPRASYEVTVDAVSGDAVPGLRLERLAADNVTVLQSAAPVGTGSAATLRWQNSSAAGVTTQHLRVGSPACGGACGPDDAYRLSAWETTAAVPRFNNAGSQVTVLLVQNASARTVVGRVYFWSGSGTLLAQQAFTLVPRALLTVSTPTVPGLAGQGGSITIAHDGGYGALAGKAVSLEPATGFSFDSPLAYRPR